MHAEARLDGGVAADLGPLGVVDARGQQIARVGGLDDVYAARAEQLGGDGEVALDRGGRDQRVDGRERDEGEIEDAAHRRALFERGAREGELGAARAGLIARVGDHRLGGIGADAADARVGEGAGVAARTARPGERAAHLARAEAARAGEEEVALGGVVAVAEGRVVERRVAEVGHAGGRLGAHAAGEDDEIVVGRVEAAERRAAGEADRVVEVHRRAVALAAPGLDADEPAAGAGDLALQAGDEPAGDARSREGRRGAEPVEIVGRPRHRRAAVAEVTGEGVGRGGGEGEDEAVVVGGGVFETVIDELERDRALVGGEGRERGEQRLDARAVLGRDIVFEDHVASARAKGCGARAGRSRTSRRARPREAKGSGASLRRRSAPRTISQRKAA